MCEDSHTFHIFVVRADQRHADMIERTVVALVRLSVCLHRRARGQMAFCFFLIEYHMFVFKFLFSVNSSNS